jgi:hypothetical protein
MDHVLTLVMAREQCKIEISGFLNQDHTRKESAVLAVFLKVINVTTALVDKALCLTFQAARVRSQNN